MRNYKSTGIEAILRPLLIGAATGCIVCVLTLVLMAFVAVSVDIPQAVVVPLATVAVSIGSFVGSFAAAKVSKRNGWLIGLLNAVILFLLSLVSGWAFFQSVNGSFIAIKLALMLAVGVLGGIVAVNSGKQKR